MTKFRPLLLALALLGAACAGNGLNGRDEQEAAYRAARERWARARPAAYSFVLERPCLCPRELVGPVLIQVRGDSVLSRTYTDTGQPVTAGSVALFGNMEAVFEVVERALEGADGITAEYDSVFGFPTNVGIDYRKNLIDDESGLKVSAFRTLTP